MAIELGDAIWRIGADNSGLQKSLNSATKMISGAMAAASGAILAGAASAVNNYTDLGDEIGKLAKRTGLSTQELSRLRHAAELSDGSVQGLGKGVQKMAGLLGDAEAGLAGATGTLDALGLSIDKSFINKNPDEVFDTFMQAIASIEDPLMRAALAEDVFGRAGREMLPMLSDGYEAFAKMKEGTEDLFSPEETAAAEKYKDAWRGLREIWESVEKIIAQALLPTLQTIIDYVNEYLSVAVDWAKENEDLVATIIKTGVALAALIGLIAPGVFVAAFGGIAAQVALAGAAIAALGYILWQSIGGWEGVGKAVTWFVNLVDQAREWLAVNWEQIVVTFHAAKDALIATGGALLEGLELVFWAIVDVVAMFVGQYIGEMTGAENETARSTDSILKSIERLASRIELQMERIRGVFSAMGAWWDEFWASIEGTAGGAVGNILSIMSRLTDFVNNWAPNLNPIGAFPAIIGNALDGYDNYQGLATGGTVSRGGWAMVGERGPELVSLPTGSTVYDAGQTRNAGGQGGNTINLNFGRDSVRSDDDIRQIEYSLTRALENGLQAAGVRL